MSDDLADRFAAQSVEWRDPAAVIAGWSEAGSAQPELLQTHVRGAWWDALAAAGVTLIVSREYEHLVLALSATPEPRITYLRLPHPSGIAFDRAAGTLSVAATRNPNQVFEFAPVTRMLARADVDVETKPGRRLVPIRSRFLPGSTYLHDLAMVGGRLHGNAVGLNAVVALGERETRAVWWPRALEHDGAPLADRNYIQLNSIAAGEDLATSYFSASGERPGATFPGDAGYPVDGLGVIFSGATREPVVRGLTRPHSARLHDGRLWVDNSGYGEVGVARAGKFEAVARLSGWTRGLAFAGDVAFVGTSRVIPRFAQYAPGLDVERSRCAITAVDVATGEVRGSIEFPSGNQIFAIEPVPAGWCDGFPFAENADESQVRALFYGYVAGS